VVGDLSGKGLAAAARTAEVRFALRAFLSETWHPAQALQRLNRFLVDAQRAEGQNREGFAAVSLAVLDPVSGEAVLAVAGMDSPLVLRQHASTEVVEARGMPLGIDPEAAYEALTVQIAPGEGILLVSDGITEARRGGDFLDVAGLKGLAEQAMKRAGACQIAGAVAGAVLEGAKAFAGGKLKDDACVLVACRR
jgi:sigma-B regulation protein RsbU (phosphoserine phosphatase)